MGMMVGGVAIGIWIDHARSGAWRNTRQAWGTTTDPDATDAQPAAASGGPTCRTGK